MSEKSSPRKALALVFVVIGALHDIRCVADPIEPPKQKTSAITQRLSGIRASVTRVRALLRAPIAFAESRALEPAKAAATWVVRITDAVISESSLVAGPVDDLQLSAFKFALATPVPSTRTSIAGGHVDLIRTSRAEVAIAFQGESFPFVDCQFCFRPRTIDRTVSLQARLGF